MGLEQAAGSGVQPYWDEAPVRMSHVSYLWLQLPRNCITSHISCNLWPPHPVFIEFIPTVETNLAEAGRCQAYTVINYLFLLYV